MDPHKLKEITSAANEAVKDLDPSLKQAAFQTILNKLLDVGFNSGPLLKKQEVVKRDNGSKKNPVKKKVGYDEDTKKLVESINRTKFSKMYDLKVTIDRALYLLQIAKDELKIDGLLATQIATVLQDNFRLKTSYNAVSMALMNATKYVDRKPLGTQGGAGFKYFIMHEGEKYLSGVLQEMKANDQKKQ